MSPTTTISRPSVRSQSQARSGQAVQPKPPAAKDAVATPPLIALKAVTKHYGPDTPGLVDVSLEIPKGGFLWVTGPSGSGKTTLLKLLYGAERPTQGTVRVQQQDVAKLKGDRLSKFRRQIGIVFQDYKLIPNRTVAENVAFVLWAQGASQDLVQRRLAPTLRVVGLSHKANAFPRHLSGGEQQRVSIARAIVGTPPLLIADEPTGNLDPENARQVMKILHQLNGMGVTVVTTTHNESLVQASSHPMVRIESGELTWVRR